MNARLNWLRAGVLGANDGIVSTAGLVVGVAGATSARGSILTAGFAGLAAGAVAMALGEYVSVSSQRDTERAFASRERRELTDAPERELAELAALYRAKGLSAPTAAAVAQELTAHDALGTHLEVELGVDPNELTNPSHAALASALTFSAGGALPILGILVSPAQWRVAVTVVVVLLALAITGAVSARMGGGNTAHAIRRIVLGGALGLVVTYAIGRFVGSVGGLS